MKRKSLEPDGRGRHRTAKEKARILRAHRRSGLSLLAFARRHELCYTSLLRWRSGQSAAPEVGAPLDSQADPRFIRVKMEGDGTDGDYVVSWPGGRSLKIPWRFEPESLRRLLSVLEGRP